MKSILRMFAVTCGALLTLSLVAAETAAPAKFSRDDLVMDGGQAERRLVWPS